MAFVMKYDWEKDIHVFLEFLSIHGCQMKPISNDERNSLKAIKKGMKLPEVYVSFMKEAGNGIRYFRGSSYTMNEICDLGEWAMELLGDDPPICFYEEGQEPQKFVLKHSSLTDFYIENHNEIEHLSHYW